MLRHLKIYCSITSINSNNNSEGVYKSLSLPEKNIKNKSIDQNENISETQIKPSKDNVNLPKEAKSKSVKSYDMIFLDILNNCWLDR